MGRGSLAIVLEEAWLPTRGGVSKSDAVKWTFFVLALLTMMAGLGLELIKDDTLVLEEQEES